MKGMTIAAMTEACGGIYHGDNSIIHNEIKSITTDSRKADIGCLFVAIKGARSDGHNYINDCLAAGALCCISERELPEELGPYIQVESSTKALRDLAKFYREQLDITVVGITGSVGKTSTKETIAAVLSRKYKVLKTIGNFNNEIGLPLTIFRLCEDDEIAVLEMGISDFGEMSRLTDIAKPDICVITNIGLCHLENLKTRDGILKAKTEIFEGMNPKGFVVLNGDDDKLATVRKVYGRKPVFFGVENKSDVYADNIKNMGLEGTGATIHNLEGIDAVDIHIPIAGQHMIYNAMAAAIIGARLGLTPQQIKDGIENIETIAGRNNIIKANKMTIIDDCYNANPVSMKASIDVLDTAKGRKVCILGDMFELGADEKKLHYDVGQYLASKSIDILFTAGELSRNIAEGAKDYIVQHNTGSSLEIKSFDDKESLMNFAKGILIEGDNILVKASHGMKFSEIVKFLKK